MAKNNYLYYGIFFLFIQIIAIIRNYAEGYNYFFWYCDFAPLLFAFGFFLKEKHFIKGLINVGLVIQVAFMLDFIHIVLMGKPFFSVNQEILAYSHTAIISTIFIHLSTIFALIFTYKERPGKKTLYFSLFFLISIYIITLLFTSPSDNTNFVYFPAESFNYLKINIPHYTQIWIPLSFLLVVIPAHFIQYVVYKKFKR